MSHHPSNTMRTLRRLAAATAGILLAGAARDARAAGDPEMEGPPTKAPERSGATVTLGVGPAEYHVVPDDGSSQRTEGAAYSVRVGTTLSPTAVLEADVEFVDAGGSRSTVLGGAVRVYSTNQLFLRFGGGMGIYSPGGSTDPGTGMSVGSKRTYGGAALFAVGYEWFQLRDLALFSEFQLAANRLVEDGAKATVVNAHLNFGITWY